MTLSGSAPPPVAAPDVFKPLWSLATGASACAVALARESGQLLAWDEHHWLYLLSPRGERQAQARPLTTLVAACIADDGSALAVVGAHGEVNRLSPDLSPRWQRNMPHPAVGVALDPFARRLAVSDARGGLYLLDGDGRTLWEAPQPRPLHHLAFVPEAPLLLGAADFGLIVCVEVATGRVAWRDGLPVHCGALATSGAGDQIVLACFSDGLRRYRKTGGPADHVTMREPCRLASLSFDGRLALVAGRANRLLLLGNQGQVHGIHLLERPAAALALAALGDRAAVALSDGGVLMLDLRSRSPLAA
jgi:hypothetical protein